MSPGFLLFLTFILLFAGVVLMVYQVLMGGFRRPEVVSLIRRFYGKITGVLGYDETLAHRLTDVFDHIDRHTQSRYDLPLFLMLGEKGTDRTHLLHHLTMHVPFTVTAKPPIAWQVYEEGMLCTLNTDIDGRRSLHTWKKFLSLVAKQRPARPLDGIILTLNCQEILQHTPLQRRRYAQMLRRQVQATEGLGLRVPVFVTLIHSQYLNGLRTWLHRMPDMNHQDVFGWSNPYAMDAPYHSQWVPKMFADILGRLKYLEHSYLVYHHDVGEDLQDILSLGQAIEALQAPLQEIFDILWAPSFFSGRHYFRGVYISAEDKANTLLLTHHMFRDKIFPEHQAVTLAPYQWLPPDRMGKILRASGVLCACFLGGTTMYHSRILRQESQKFQNILQDLTHLRGQNTLIQDNFAHYLQSVLQCLESLKFSYSSHYTFPVSWLSTVDRTITQAISRLYQTLIFSFMGQALKHQALTLHKQTIQETEIFREGHPLTLPSYTALHRYVHRLLILQKAGSLYNNLHHSYRWQDLDFIMQTAFRFPLPRPWRQEKNYLSLMKKLASTPQVMYELPGDVMSNHLQQMYETFLTQANTLETIYPSFPKLHTTMHGLMGKKLTPKALELFSQHISQLMTVFYDPQAQWVKYATFNPGASYKDLWTQVSRLHCITPKTRQHILTYQHQVFSQFRGKILAYGHKMTGPFLYQGNQKVSLSGTLMQMYGMINWLLGESFIKSAQRQGTPTSLSLKVSKDMKILWNFSYLKQATQAVEQYQNFSRDVLTQFPKYLWKSLRTMALDHLNQSLAFYLNAAQQRVLKDPRDSQDDELMKDVQNLKMNQKYLMKVLDQCKTLKFLQHKQYIEDILHQQSLYMLGKIDEVFVREKGYHPLKSTVISGDQQNLSGVLFRLSIEGEIKHYLDRVRGRWMYLSQELAATPLNILSYFYNKHTVKRPGLYDKWQAIYQVMGEYDTAMDGQNSVRQLEDFILSLEKETVQSYRKKVTPYDGNHPVLQTLHHVQHQAAAVCYTHRYHHAKQAYTALYTFFQTHIAGKFPFGPYTTQEDVLISHMQEMYRLYDILYTYPLQDIISAKHGVYTFLQDLKTVRPLMENMMHRRAIFFTLDWHNQPERETGVNQIFDSLIKIGSEQFGHTQTTHHAWSPGINVMLLLRWAKQSFTKPRYTKNQFIQVKDRDVQMTYGQTWGLLRFFYHHRDKAAQMVVRIPSTQDPKVPGAEVKESQTSMTMKLRFYTDEERKNAVDLPVLPYGAPMWKDTV